MMLPVSGSRIMEPFDPVCRLNPPLQLVIGVLRNIKPYMPYCGFVMPALWSQPPFEDARLGRRRAQIRAYCAWKETLSLAETLPRLIPNTNCCMTTNSP